MSTETRFDLAMKRVFDEMIDKGLMRWNKTASDYLPTEEGHVYLEMSMERAERRPYEATVRVIVRNERKTFRWRVNARNAREAAVFAQQHFAKQVAPHAGTARTILVTNTAATVFEYARYLTRFIAIN